MGRKKYLISFMAAFLTSGFFGIMHAADIVNFLKPASMPRNCQAMSDSVLFDLKKTLHTILDSSDKSQQKVEKLKELRKKTADLKNSVYVSCNDEFAEKIDGIVNDIDYNIEKIQSYTQGVNSEK